MDDQITPEMELAKHSACIHLEQALLWMNSRPMDWSAFQHLERAIAIEMLERSVLELEQKNLIRAAWAIFRLDVAVESVRRLAAVMASDTETQENLIRFSKALEERG